MTPKVVTCPDVDKVRGRIEPASELSSSNTFKIHLNLEFTKIKRKKESAGLLEISV